MNIVRLLSECIGKLIATLYGLKKVGTLAISFYERTCTVDYETKTDKKEENIDGELLNLFGLYFAKMIYNLSSIDRGEVSRQLIQAVAQCSDKVLKETAKSKKLDVPPIDMLPEDCRIVLTTKKSIAKVYKASLYLNRKGNYSIMTHFDAGGESYYCNLSTLVLFQYLMNRFPSRWKIILALRNNGICEYYLRRDRFDVIEDVIKASVYAYERTANMLSNPSKN